MERIEFLDKVIKERMDCREAGVTGVFVWAYWYSVQAGNELINFNDVIWDRDIDGIIADCKRFGISEFTISSTFSNLITTIAEFQKRGCVLAGLVEINSTLDDWKKGMEGIIVKERIPAFKIVVG